MRKSEIVFRVAASPRTRNVSPLETGLSIFHSTAAASRKKWKIYFDDTFQVKVHMRAKNGREC